MAAGIIPYGVGPGAVGGGCRLTKWQISVGPAVARVEVVGVWPRSCSIQTGG